MRLTWNGILNLWRTENGTACKNRDCQKLAQAVVTLLKDRALAEKLGVNARKLLEEKYI